MQFGKHFSREQRNLPLAWVVLFVCQWWILALQQEHLNLKNRHSVLLQQLDRILIWCHPFLLSAVKTQIVQFEFRNEHRRVIDDCVKIVYEISLIALTRDGKVKKKWLENMRKREHACIYVTLDSFAATMLLFCEKPFKSFSQSAKKSSSSTFLLLLSSCSCVSKNS